MKEREKAYICLCKIINEKQFSNIALRNIKDNTPFITQLVYGTLRNYRLCRKVWSKNVDRLPNSKIAILLDMACYELLFMDSASYGVVNEIVDIASTIKKGSYKSLVNALLRKVDKSDLIDLTYGERYSCPDWLISLWQKQYGKEVAEMILKSSLKEAKVGLRVNTLITTKEELLKDEKFTSGKVPNSLYYQGNIIDTDYFKEHKVFIQSLSAQEAVETMQVKDDSLVLDLCAAPGTKSVQMAIEMHNTGKIVANDVYPKRCKLIEENASKYGLTNITTVCFDGREIDKHLENKSFDHVLVDAPCSGLGTLRHKPEIKITTTPNGLDQLVSLQKALLETASRMVKINGTLLYSTCTLNKKENEKQIETFLKEHADFTLVESKTIFPDEHDSDGFFVAKLKCLK